MQIVPRSLDYIVGPSSSAVVGTCGKYGGVLLLLALATAAIITADPGSPSNVGASNSNNDNAILRTKKASRSHHHSPSTGNSGSTSTQFQWTPSVLQNIYGEDEGISLGKIVILATHVEHHIGAPWLISQQFLDELSANNNNNNLHKPSTSTNLACHFRMLGIALNSTLDDIGHDGVASVQIQYFDPVTNKSVTPATPIYCHVSTNRHLGNDFYDRPKTRTVALNCPVTLDMELGAYQFSGTMHKGRVCTPLATLETTVTIHDIKTTLAGLINATKDTDSITGTSTSPSSSSSIAAVVLNPAAIRAQEFAEMTHGLHRHSVCTVQTFKNDYSGYMLFLFVKYWIRLGWSVIVYDRYGAHRSFIQPLLKFRQLHYHPYTALQKALPGIYNETLFREGGERAQFKFYYAYEKTSALVENGTLAEQGNLDSDKTKTFDLARVEYAHMPLMLFADSDEFLVCPGYGMSSFAQQARAQHSAMARFVASGVQEMRFVSLAYASSLPEPSVAATRQCMSAGFERQNMTAMFSCWGDMSVFDSYPKSADIGRICPFHYNHWSCDGMKNGGRDGGGGRAALPRPQCRCKVGFEMSNDHAYSTLPQRCHLMHLNHARHVFLTKGKRGRSLRRGNSSDPNPATILTRHHGGSSSGSLASSRLSERGDNSALSAPATV